MQTILAIVVLTGYTVYDTIGINSYVIIVMSVINVRGYVS